jgi:hypothetical protein
MDGSTPTTHECNLPCLDGKLWVEPVLCLSNLFRLGRLIVGCILITLCLYPDVCELVLVSPSNRDQQYLLACGQSD